ncbi:MAG TPA: hypothetical protein P5534_20675, partial [Candidatus Paceibacterota bacterium]|nr:hypothetical protein [Candidatus Paceibacterota bacterium]
MTPQTLRIGGGVEYLPGTSERKLAVDATLSSGTNNLNKIMGGWMIRGQLKPNRTSHLEDARNVNRTGCMADKLTPKERMRRTLERRP